MNLAQQIILTIALLKIFFNIIMTNVNEEMSSIEIIIRHTETMISYLDKQDLMEEMTDEVTLVDFFANWCGPCKMLGEELEEMKDVKIIKIDTDTHEDLAHEHGVMSIPYVEIYKNKELVTKFIGFKTKDEIEEILKNL